MWKWNSTLVVSIEVSCVPFHQIWLTWLYIAGIAGVRNSSGSVLGKMIVKTTKRNLNLHHWMEKASRCMIFRELVPVESVSQQTKKNWWWFLPRETFKGREPSSLVVTLVVILLKGLTVFEGWSNLRRGRIRPNDCQQRKSEIYDHFT